METIHGHWFQTHFANGQANTVSPVLYYQFNFYLPSLAMADGAEDAGNETITLRVKDQTGDEMFFKVKKNTKMQVSNTTYKASYASNYASLFFITPIGINKITSTLRFFPSIENIWCVCIPERNCIRLAQLPTWWRSSDWRTDPENVGAWREWSDWCQSRNGTRFEIFHFFALNESAPTTGINCFFQLSLINFP